MRALATFSLVAVAISVAAPASAAVLGFTNVQLSGSPTNFQVTPETGFAFSYDAAAAASFNPDTYSVRTSGTGQTSAFGGFLGIPLRPSVFRTDASVLIDGNLFPSYAAFSALTPIPFSLVAGDLALRYSVGDDFFYGYARLNGNGTLNIAFESQANTAIVAGSAITGALPAVPEPATWAMMIGGFGLVGAAMRRRTNRTAIA